ncbi:hypothetical protein [Dyadobacter sp. LHD-138]|uniref:hypothetical protein n=1 Tax=Dyadobacter sp. LHD-138 TaxID=3071413 RepID=UPI0027E0832E|nr:hypothetical protein [Dyadobacter sp. LHD-138]MDQ6479998.1 hypothetical protein [Dyadobacter sp. LHD-138]
MNALQEKPTEKQIKSDEWFNEFIWSLRADQAQLAAGGASKEKQDMYHSLMDSNITDMVDVNVRSAKKHYISSMLIDYLNELKRFEESPFTKLAASFNNSELLIWAEIKEDEWDIEKSLIMAEAKINATYHEKGFDMTTTIVEDCDQLCVPSHYIMLYGNK